MTEWWRDAVLFEVYVRSFQDSDGDGVGDLQGIRSRLPYLRDLGVDGLWLTPFYPSPGHDHGYDVSDYCDVDPRFGTLADFDALVADAHALGLRLVVDIVPNHTSSEHPWFRERPEYYVWADEPNNWPSSFGGPAWTFDEERGRFYLHLFAPEQPDLDWHNPDVRAEFERILRFWLDRGVDGFRVDVAQVLFKARDLHDVEEPSPRPWWADWHTGVDQPELDALYASWRRIADEYDGDRMFVGEIVLRDQATLARYVSPGRLQLAFNFAVLHEEWDAAALRAVIDATLEELGAVGAPATWVFENHDVTRLPTRFGGGALGRRRARAAALLLLALPGTAFVYQGQELGLEEVDLPDEVRQDPIFFRTDGERAGRDGCRVPVPWDDEPPTFGFTTGVPWLPMPADWAARASERDETRELYRAALALRPRGGAFAWRDSPPGTLVFERGDLVCAINLGEAPVPLPRGAVMLASDAAVRDELPADTAVWLRRGER